MSDGWLRKYVAFTARHESPEYFHLWCGSSVIAAAMGRRTHLNRGFYVLYPNLYVILVAGSATTRKTAAMRLATSILKDSVDKSGAPLAFVAQKITAEALIEYLKEMGDYPEGYVVSEEFSVFARGQDSLIDIMTQAYDCPEPFAYRTRMHGEEVCKTICMNLLAATTPSSMQQTLTDAAIGGGFTSRIITVYQNEGKARIVMTTLNKEEIALRAELVDDMQRILKLRGTFVFSAEATDWFTHWYEEVFKPEDIDELSGYFGRKHDSVLKLAMCLSASDDSSLIIQEDHVAVALDMINQTEQYLPKMIRLVQKTPVGVTISKVLKHITNAESAGIMHSHLIRRMGYCAPAKEVKELLEHLMASGEITEVVAGKAKYYVAVKNVQ